MRLSRTGSSSSSLRRRRHLLATVTTTTRTMEGGVPRSHPDPLDVQHPQARLVFLLRLFLQYQSPSFAAGTRLDPPSRFVTLLRHARDLDLVHLHPSGASQRSSELDHLRLLPFPNRSMSRAARSLALPRPSRTSHRLNTSHLVQPTSTTTMIRLPSFLHLPSRRSVHLADMKSRPPSLPSSTLPSSIVPPVAALDLVLAPHLHHLAPLAKLLHQLDLAPLRLRLLAAPLRELVPARLGTDLKRTLRR